MKIVKYITLINRLSKIEGQKESLIGQHNLSTKLYRRGDMNEEDFKIHSATYFAEMQSLRKMRRSALRQYAAAA
jgi:hypothetical protein